MFPRCPWSPSSLSPGLQSQTHSCPPGFCSSLSSICLPQTATEHMFPGTRCMARTTSVSFLSSITEKFSTIICGDSHAP